MSETLLFSPLQIKGLTLKNRIVVAPMHQYSADKGFATDWHVVNAGKFAQGGAGLVFMESTKVARNGCGTVGDLALWNDDFIPGLARCVDFIKQHGAAAALQLGHSGRKARLTRPWEGGKPLEPGPETFDWEDWDLVGPSPVPHTEKSPTPRPLSHMEIGQMIEKWGAAAERANRAGFDVLEIHAAHGYLLHQFLSPVSNTRNDEYGGSLESRMRFPTEVAECVRANWPDDKPLFMRLSCVDDAGWELDDSVALSKRLKAVGIDVIDCSSGGTLKFSPMDGERSQRYGYQVPFADRIRKDADIMTMAVGHIVHADQAEEILQSGRADLIAIGREMLYNPNWAMDAAQKLGVDPDFGSVPSPYSYWLSRRSKSKFEGKPSTWQVGIGGNV